MRPLGDAHVFRCPIIIVATSGGPIMLVLLRKKNQSVVIADEITVTVVDIREDNVRLGFVMPKEIPVHRQEVYDEVYKTRPKPKLGLPRRRQPEDPWASALGRTGQR